MTTMQRNDAIEIICDHTKVPRYSPIITKQSDSDLIYWAVKIRDGIAAARAYRNA